MLVGTGRGTLGGGARSSFPGIAIVQSRRLTARDVMNTTRIIATRAAVERLQEVLA